MFDRPPLPGRRRGSQGANSGARHARRPISPLVGEMSGRTEGGAVERRPRSLPNFEHGHMFVV
ncbi:hypothetical protein FJ428_04640 [Mesorhizobium sp. B2-8-1]|nr:hypothetical protein FJ428_04640 [Mesorhizobium sp. B2-8-1]TPM45405.1 hypothetical protein FJ951_16280 [Mesorhizobium sp. B2-2-3]